MPELGPGAPYLALAGLRGRRKPAAWPVSGLIPSPPRLRPSLTSLCQSRASSTTTTLDLPRWDRGGLGFSRSVTGRALVCGLPARSSLHIHLTNLPIAEEDPAAQRHHHQPERTEHLHSEGSLAGAGSRPETPDAPVGEDLAPDFYGRSGKRIRVDEHGYKSIVGASSVLDTRHAPLAASSRPLASAEE